MAFYAVFVISVLALTLSMVRGASVGQAPDSHDVAGEDTCMSRWLVAALNTSAQSAASIASTFTEMYRPIDEHNAGQYRGNAALQALLGGQTNAGAVIDCITKTSSSCHQLSACSHHGQCVFTSHPVTMARHYRCDCASGYTGRFCETVVSSCASNPCQHGGRCVELGDVGYHCHCTPLHRGVNCETKWFSWKKLQEMQATDRQLAAANVDLARQVEQLKSEVSEVRRDSWRQTQAYLERMGKNLTATLEESLTRFEDRSGGGWTRVGEMKPQQTHACPSAFTYSASFGGMCMRPTSGQGSAATVTYSSRGIRYSEVMGYVKGYMYNTPDAFSMTGGNTPYYVDGVTFRSASYHLWSYGAGGHPIHPCPCKGGRQPQSFIGTHYTCSQDFTASAGGKWVPAWQGSCGSNTCCPSEGFPWFKRSLGGVTTSPILVSIMCDQNTVDENIAISEMEIYIR